MLIHMVIHMDVVNRLQSVDTAGSATHSAMLIHMVIHMDVGHLKYQQRPSHLKQLQSKPTSGAINHASERSTWMGQTDSKK